MHLRLFIHLRLFTRRDLIKVFFFFRTEFTALNEGGKKKHGRKDFMPRRYRHYSWLYRQIIYDQG